jgi:glycosyltransferase involved in cell wall biosynthesis
VAIIVSLYNAAAKLPCFLQALQSQTLVREQQVEFIFIDSHSPAQECEALCKTPLAFPISYVFARTSERETIQTAWNRGIELSRSPYLTFLGVDETIVPEALEILSSELDNDADLDWVQGNSLVTEVNADGVFANDVMMYDRSGYTPYHVYLDTCYLSWVGALYRRSIHDRLGYYDGTFRAAGDTEFKGRLLPFLKTKCIPQTLGVFLNYPEARTTASPTAELEDLRAWYLHRSFAGVDYALQRRDPIDAEKLLLLALQHRKSFLPHASTDVEYALNVADYLAERAPASPTLGLAAGIADLLEAYRSLDDIQPLTVRQFADTLLQTQKTVERIQKNHRSTPWLQQVEYKIYNDNRHEQHHFFY